VIALLPGFLRFFWYYVWTSHRVVCNYNTQSWRQSLDVYKVKHSKGDLLAPVVVFYTGGAWCIGYKMWGALMARALTQAGILVVIPDYRNYPSVCIPDMVEDVKHSLLWVKQHISEYGGDPNKTVVAGQSAGGHLACTLLLKKAVELMESLENDDAFRPTDFCGFVSLSAPYDLDAMQNTFREHGLDDEIVDRVFAGQGPAYEPMQLARECQKLNYDLTGKIPPMIIMHGTADITVPHHGSVTLCEELEKVVDNGTVEFISYDGWSHTDGILEMPMNANHRFHRDVFDTVKDWTSSKDLEWPKDDPVIAKRLCPKFMVSIGKRCNPF